MPMLYMNTAFGGDNVYRYKYESYYAAIEFFCDVPMLDFVPIKDSCLCIVSNSPKFSPIICIHVS